jgi:tetratricopeptide (TPR) repeat protein
MPNQINQEVIECTLLFEPSNSDVQFVHVSKKESTDRISIDELKEKYDNVKDTIYENNKDNWDHLIKYMNDIAEQTQELSAEEIDLLFKVYDYIFNPNNKDIIYNIDIINNIENYLIPNSSNLSHENKVFYYYKLGEYYERLSNYDKAKDAYKSALKIAVVLEADNLIYLRLVLKSAVFYDKILKEKNEAVNLVITALNKLSDVSIDDTIDTELKSIDDTIDTELKSIIQQLGDYRQNFDVSETDSSVPEINAAN